MRYVHMNDPDEPMIANMKKRITELEAENAKIEARIAELTEALEKESFYARKQKALRVDMGELIYKQQAELTALRSAAWFILRLGRDGMWDSAHMGHAHGALAALVEGKS